MRGERAPLRGEVWDVLLFGKHEEYLLFTDEGFDDAVAAFPQARTCITPAVCAASPAFAEALRSFCAETWN